MRQPRGLTFPNRSSPRAALARRQKMFHGAVAETSSRGRRACDDEIRLRRLAGGTATNHVREPRRRIARARGSLSGLRSVPATAQRGEKLAKTLSDWQQCQRGAAVVVGWLRDSTNRAQSPRRRTARAPGALAGLAHVPPWLTPYARRSGRRHRRGDGVASGAAHHLAAGVLLLVCFWRANMS